MRTLTVTAMLAVAAAALTGCGNVSFGTDEETRSYTAPSGVTELKIAGDGGRVEVTASDTPVIKVSERLRWSNDDNKPKVEHATENGTLTLSAECARATIGVTRCGVSYRVQVPRDTPVAIDSRNGSIDASGLGGTVRLHSEHGSIEADGLHATSATLSSRNGSIRVSGRAATADLRSDNGSITAEGLTGDRLTARSSNGRISLSGRVGTADLRSDNGSVRADGLAAERVTAVTRNGGMRFRFTEPPADVQATSSDGSIRVGLPAGEGYDIRTTTEDGRERIDSGVHQDPSSSHHLKLNTRNGGVTVTPADQRSW
ncbi:DUF4097 family beta strand repeat-containing protein [Actinomadura welshii]